MSSEPKKEGPCLLARAVPCKVPDPAEEIVKGFEQLTVKDSSDRSIIENNEQPSVSPSKFVALQSVRSSAFARKTSTTQMFSKGGQTLFDDLLNTSAKPPEKKDNKKEDTKKEDDKEEVKKEKEDKDGDEKTEDSEEDIEKKLISRGPYQKPKTSNNLHHPYYDPNMRMQFGAAPVTPVDDYTALSQFGSGYDVGWLNSPESYISNSSTPDTLLYDQGGYAPYPSPPIGPMSGKGNDRQLPEELSEFILNNSMLMNKNASPACSKHDGQESPSADSGVDSPLSARSAPNASPEVPQGSSSGPTTPSFNHSRLSPRSGSRGECTEAKDALRARISETDVDEQNYQNGWLWSLKCLEYQQTEQSDLMLFITAHNDLVKIYCLVQQLLKVEGARNRPVFDLPNENNETPLYLATLNRSDLVVAYLLEAGASPNCQTKVGERDTALHYAASHGLIDITKAIASTPGAKLETQNARGLTALLSAIRAHGKLDDLTQTTIDNKYTVAQLLSAGANPRCVDAIGKTVFHYAVESMDPSMVELLWKHIDPDTVTELVNTADRAGETPMQLVIERTDAAKGNMIMPLLSCGANIRS